MHDHDQARALAELEGKHLFLWVGGCDPELRECFPEAIHCHLDEYQGTTEHTLLVPGEPGWVYAWSHPTKEAAPAVRAVLQRLRGNQSAACSGGSCRTRRR